MKVWVEAKREKRRAREKRFMVLLCWCQLKDFYERWASRSETAFT
jgi:hypothetical protein